MVQYQCAWSFDVIEKENEAIHYYESTIELGLPDNDLKEALLGLGSTYRSIGEYAKSKQIFERGIPYMLLFDAVFDKSSTAW